MIIHGDCLEKLRELKESSVDSVVTDPPAGISFMGKAWDDDKGGRDEWISWLESVMRECLQVLKPGGHALVWAIPRTSHWTTTAVENAGFEIRDIVTHLFGSGFPKSLDISKAIDKEAGAKREVIGIKGTSPDIRGGSYDGQVTSERDRLVNYETAPTTDNAKKWQGFGTALKPAAEFWILARKPLSEKTVAKNVLKHGTGGLNIDASRIEPTSEKDLKDIRSERASTSKGQFAALTTDDKLDRSDRSHVTGRFPANLVFTEGEATEMLDKQSGLLQSRPNKNARKVGQQGMFYENHNPELHRPQYETAKGGASRFFYCAKVSPSERGEDNNHPTVKPIKLMQYLIRLITPPGGIVLDPFMGSGSTGLAAKRAGFEFIGIEREKEYFEIAEKRIKAFA